MPSAASSGPQACRLIRFFGLAIIWRIHWPLLQDLTLRDRLRKVQAAGICWVTEPAYVSAQRSD